MRLLAVHSCALSTTISLLLKFSILTSLTAHTNFLHRIKKGASCSLKFLILSLLLFFFVSLLFPMRSQKAHIARAFFCFPFVYLRETIRNNQKYPLPAIIVCAAKRRIQGCASSMRLLAAHRRTRAFLQGTR